MKSHDSQRRILLRGTLAAGVTLMLAACGKKEEKSAPGTPMSQPPMSEPPMTQPPMGETPQSGQPKGEAQSSTAQTPKVSKTIAQYQEKPKDGKKCATCANFIAESNTCKVVEGPINPEGWCIYWLAT